MPRCARCTRKGREHWKTHGVDLLGRGVFTWRCDVCRAEWYESRVCGCSGDQPPVVTPAVESGFDAVECGPCGATWRALAAVDVFLKRPDQMLVMAFETPLIDPAPSKRGRPLGSKNKARTMSAPAAHDDEEVV